MLTKEAKESMIWDGLLAVREGTRHLKWYKSVRVVDAIFEDTRGTWDAGTVPACFRKLKGLTVIKRASR